MAVLVLFQLDEHDGSYDGGGHGFLEWFIIYYYVVTLTRTAHNTQKYPKGDQKEITATSNHLRKSNQEGIKNFKNVDQDD